MAAQVLTGYRQSGAGWRRFGLLVMTNATAMLRAKDYVFWISLFPIGLMLLLGTIMSGGESGAPDSATLIRYLAPGVLVLSLISNGIGHAETMAIYRERGILRRVQATPLSLWEFLLAQIAVQTVILTVQAGLMIGTSMVVFGARYDGVDLLKAVPAVIFGAVVFIALGQVVASLVRKVTTVNLVTMTLLVPLMFLGNLWTLLPADMEPISSVLPSTMMADLLRALLGTATPETTILAPEIAFVGLVAYLVASLVISIRFFRWN